MTSYKKIIIGFLLGLVALAGCFVALYIYCEKKTEEVHTYDITEYDFGMEHDGLVVSFENRDDKVWTNIQEEGVLPIGAQYEFVFENHTSYPFYDWSGTIEMNDIWEMDSLWNFDYELDGDIIKFVPNTKDTMTIQPGENGKIGCIMNSNTRLLPKQLTVAGHFKYVMRDMIAYKLLSYFAFGWLLAFVFAILFKSRNLGYIEKQLHDAAVIKGLASRYETSLLVDLENGDLKVISYKNDEFFKQCSDKTKYTDWINYLYSSCFDKDEILKFRNIQNIDGLREALKEKPDLLRRFKASYNDNVYYYEIVFLLSDDAGHCTILISDVDEEYKKELKNKEALRLAAEAAEQANQSKSDFLSRMSHEIRTPMNAVIGMSEIILRSELSEKQREYVGVIKNSGRALLNLINDVVDLSKIEAGKMELNEAVYVPEDFFHELQILLKTRAMDKEVSVELDIDKKLPEALFGDELKLRQILINLANNSIKYTEKGYVKIVINVVERYTSRIKLRVAVKDSGMGIKEEDMQKIFDAFKQVDTEKNRNKEGTGLGLSIAKQMVELLGGEIHVESVYGEGSEFSFEIIQGIAEKPKVDEGEEKSFTAPGARVLVVDDNEINLLVATGLMDIYKMQIDTAGGGVEAVEKVKASVAAGKPYDIVFMDMIMPDLDGIEATRLLKSDSATRDICVIALTADASKECRERIIEAGMSGYLAKPMEMNMVNQTLLKYLPAELIVE